MGQGRQFYVHALYRHLIEHMKEIPNLSELDASTSEVRVSYMHPACIHAPFSSAAPFLGAKARQKQQRTLLVMTVFNSGKELIYQLGLSEAMYCQLAPLWAGGLVRRRAPKELVVRACYLPPAAVDELCLSPL